MKNKLYIPFLSLGLLIASVSFAQDDKTKKDEGKKTEQDSTKKSGGTRMAINSQGLPTKGGTKSSTNNKTASDPKKDETTPKKEDPKK